MAGSLNKVQLIGNVGRDPEMRYLQSGEPVTTFSLATNRRWTGQDGQPREETEWHNVVAWRRLAEQCNEYLTKGRKIYVEGRLQTRSWDDPATGQKKYRTEIVADRMLLLDARGDRAGATSEGDDGETWRPDEADAEATAAVPF
jgi:single-strand DNA-binding protein